jgi:prolipoprotein diacylglyceryltransferase
VLVLWVDRRYRRDGLPFLAYLALYSTGRFVLTFVRQENITLWGLQQAQVIALLALVVSAAAILYLSRKGRVVEASVRGWNTDTPPSRPAEDWGRITR